MRFPFELPAAISSLFGGGDGNADAKPTSSPPNRDVFLPPTNASSPGRGSASYDTDSFTGRGGHTHPLYIWEPFSAGDLRRTRFFPTSAYSQFIYSPGHPWCSNGFGDAFARVLSGLFKTEVGVILANTAAGLSDSASGLLFDSEKGDFISDSSSSLFPRLEKDDDPVYRSVAIPLLSQIVRQLFGNDNMGTKLRNITDVLCQLSDAEAAARPFGDNNVYFCFIEDLVAALLVCGQSYQTADCSSTINKYVQTTEDFPDAMCNLNQRTLQSSEMGRRSFTFDDKSLSIPVSFFDYLKGGSGTVPRNIPDDVIAQESLTYLALFRGLIIASSFSRSPYLCGAERIHSPILVPGWSVPMAVALRQEGDPMFAEPGLHNDAIPAIFISQSEARPCSFIIFARGTASMFEWVADFMYGQVPFANHPEIGTHMGFSNLFHTEAPVIEAFIRAQTQKHHCHCDETRLIFTGHSLGAGVAQLLALYFAERYGLETCGADISGAFFAPPRMFNQAGNDYFRANVNGRVLTDVADGLAYMPCFDGNAKRGWSRCPKGHMFLPGEGRDFYTENYGIVEISVDFSDILSSTTVGAAMQSLFPSGERNRPSAMALLLSKLVNLAVPSLNVIPSLGMLGAAHVCSFACRFSTRACGEDFRWWCDTCPMLI